MVDFSIYNDDGDSLADIDYIGHGRDGGFAEFIAVPDENAHIADNNLTDAELATFCCAYLTGEHMLDRADVRADERVLISGASGGVGSGLIQLCRARGAIPYAVTSAAKLQAVKALGAQAVIDRASPSLIDATRQVLEGHAVDVVADLVGGELFNPLLQLLRPEGRYTTAGAIGGPLVQMDLRTIYLKHLAIHGSSQGTRAAFQRLMHYVNTGRIKPILDSQFKLSDFHQAQTYFMKKNFVGKVVVVPDAQWPNDIGDK
jgi:NADPH:quinone reductase-like Zn-dependent oxidoreductase